MVGNGEDVELVVHHDAVLVPAQREEEPLIEPGLDLGVRVSPVPLVHVHRYRMQLLQTRHGLEQEDDQPSALHRLDGPAEQVGRECLEVLEDEHLEGVSEYLVRFLVVGVPDFVGADEELEGVVDVLIVEPLHLHVLDLLHALLLVAAELEVALVAPEDLGFGAVDAELAEHVVEVEHLVPRPVPHEHQHRALAALVPVLDQGLNTAVDLLLHC